MYPSEIKCDTLLAATTDEACQSIVWRDGEKVYKISRGVVAITENEVNVRRAIESKHLVPLLGVVDVKPAEAPNPQVRSFLEGYPYKPASVWKYLEGRSLQEFITDEDTSMEAAYNCMMQVFYTILSLQEKYNFMHGDLHCTNVRVITTPRAEKFTWEFGGKSWELPNLGYTSVIIDLGNATLWDRPSDLLIPLYGYKVGDVCLFYDPTFDLRVFGDSVAQVFWNSRASRFCHRFRLFLDNIFRQYGPGRLESESGRPIPIADFYGDFSDALAEMKLPKPLERAEDHLDVIMCLVGLPLPKIPPLPPRLFDDGGELNFDQLKALYFSKKSPIVKFFTKWHNFSWMLHSRQSDFLLEGICEWCRKVNAEQPTATLEAEFFSFVDSRIKLMGLNNIALSKTDTSLLMAYTFAMQKELTHAVTVLTAPFYVELRKMLANTKHFIESSLKAPLSVVFALGLQSLEQFL